MQRSVFERVIIDGYRTPKTESIAMASQGTRMFVGTNDGSLILYDCRMDLLGNKGQNCSIIESLRKQPKDKKPVSSLITVNSWRAMIGIIDGLVMAYDSQFIQSLSTIQESKGCHLFAVHDKNHTVVVAVKKKLFHYTWQSPNFVFRKEFSVSETPKNLCCVGNAVIIGYKKYYECLDLASGNTSRLLDVEKEHKMVLVELPATQFRAHSVLVSLGTNGVVLDAARILSGASFAFGSANEERLEWSSSPVSAQVVSPFLVSVLPDSVEIHDLVSLAALQRIIIASPSPHILSTAACMVESTTANNSFTKSLECFFICNGEQLSFLRMTPLHVQVQTLVSNNQYDDAINMCLLCSQSHPEYVRDVNIAQLYEASANALLIKGDFDKAINNYIQAKTDFVAVIRQFPDLVPNTLHVTYGITITPRRLVGPVLHRAAAALVQFCDHHRPKILKWAERAEKIKEQGIAANSIMGAASLKGYVPDDDEDYIVDVEDDIRKAQLLDTVLLSALVSCHPSKRNTVVELLSVPNRCQIESCSVLLASQGNSYTEALLWLFRSQNQHVRVLQALSEDKCVGAGAWTKEEFYQWTSEYLRWLWYHEEDASLPKQALYALKPVLEYDAEVRAHAAVAVLSDCSKLGLSVLISRPAGKSSFGGKGVTISDVLQFLRSVTPRTNTVKVAYGQANKARNSVQLESRASLFGGSGVQGVVSSTPLVNGHALGVAFLECLVSSGEAPPSMHDEFAQLLVEGLPFDNELKVNHALNDLEVTSTDNEAMTLYKIYRKKLQCFLQNSTEYHPQRVLKFIPQQYLHETALVLSKLGNHREVLNIYVHQLKSLVLAESYCDRIFRFMSDAKHRPATANTTPNTRGGSMSGPSTIHTRGTSFGSQSSSFSQSMTQLIDPGEIYLILFRVLLDSRPQDGEEEHLSGPDQLQHSLETVIKLAEKNFDRIDASLFVDMLPPSTPVHLVLKYLRTVMEFNNTKKRNLKIVHQLLRTRDVNSRYDHFSKLSTAKSGGKK